jgi:1-aminocyclopropane-1-carboxylate deaminase
MQALGRILEQQLKGDYTAVCMASGTGTSLAGLAAGIDREKPAIGFSVLKGEGGLGDSISRTYRQLCDSDGADNWRLMSGFHAGGYGKKHPEYLSQFWQGFERTSGIPLDPIYTLKLFWGIIPSRSKVIGRAVRVLLRFIPVDSRGDGVLCARNSS